MVRVAPSRYLWFALLLMSNAPCSIAGDQIQIVGGSPTSQWPGIGALVTTQGDLVCTGVLVGPESVLSASHCMDQSDSLPAFFLIGPDADQPQQAYAVAQIHRHPGYNDITLANDVALVRLAQTATQAPLALRTTPLTDAVVGSNVQIVGYGLDGAGVSGIKRHATTQIEYLDATALGVGLSGPPQACAGDSGGPLFVTTSPIPLIYGVSSYVIDPNCQTGAFYQRVDTASVSSFLAGFDRLCFEGDACTFILQNLVFRDGFDAE